MKVLIQRVVDGTHEVTIIPAPASKLPPVVVRGKDEEAVFAEVGRVIDAVASGGALPV